MISHQIRSRIRKEREARGYTQEAFALRLEMDKRTYRRIESGENKFLDADLLQRISEVLDIPLTRLLPVEGLDSAAIRDGLAAGAVSHNEVMEFISLLRDTQKNLNEYLRESIENYRRLNLDQNVLIGHLRDERDHLEQLCQKLQAQLGQ